jgi:hypothetical protein
MDIHAQGTAYPAWRRFALIQIKGPGRAVGRRPAQGRMARILKGTNLHAATASRAEVIVNIYGVLCDDGPIAIGTPLDGLDARMG